MAVHCPEAIHDSIVSNSFDNWGFFSLSSWPCDPGYNHLIYASSDHELFGKCCSSLYSPAHIWTIQEVACPSARSPTKVTSFPYLRCVTIQRASLAQINWEAFNNGSTIWLSVVSCIEVMCALNIKVTSTRAVWRLVMG